MVQGETSVIAILNFNGVYLPFWFSVSQMIWILLHDLWKSLRGGIIKSLKSFFALMNRCPNFKCHLDYECFHDSAYSTLGYHSKGYLFAFDDHTEVIIGSSNITRYALLKNIEWDVVVRDDAVYQQAMAEFEDK